jgi:transketolase
MNAILDAYAEARATSGRPTINLARTIKGKGIPFVEGQEGWHGKPFKKGEEADRAIAVLEQQLVPEPPGGDIASRIPRPSTRPADPPAPTPMAPPAYKMGDQVATREAYGTAIAKLAEADVRVVALDADVKNSTFSEKLEKVAPERFYQNFIAEQVMVGSAMGLAARGAIPFPSTFACFLTRAADFVRMGAIGNNNVKFAGSHAGVSIGEDGPSQMALEDLSMMRATHGCAVLYPCDAVSTERLVAEMARHKGMAYMRTSRPPTKVIYGPEESFPIGGSKVIKKSDDDIAAVIGAGVTLFEALEAYDQLKAEGISIRVIDAYSVEPIDAKTMIEAGKATNGALITVEDHYPSGGIGDAVSEAVASAGFTVTRLAVREVPRSGQPDELIDRYGISARAIVQAVRQRAASRARQGATRS